MNGCLSPPTNEEPMEIIVRSLVEAGSVMPRWNRFVDILKECIIELGHGVRVVGCESLYPTDPFPSQFSIFPHATKRDIPTGRLFYKELHLKGLFTLDPLGWGADHSGVLSPLVLEDISEEAALAIVQHIHDHYFADGQSKIEQPRSSSFDETVKPFWLVPLQKEADQTIRYFSSGTVVDFVHVIADWAESKNRHVVFKPHPANEPRVSAALTARLKGSSCLFQHHGNIHDLIRAAMGVVVINSGTGFESLVHGKPVAVYGGCDYQSACFRMNDENLNEIDDYFLSHNRDREIQSYRFVYHYMRRHAFETNESEASEDVRTRVKAIISQAVSVFVAEPPTPARRSGAAKLPSHLGGHGSLTHTDRGALSYFRELGCKSMLDVGCGPGDQVAEAISLGYRALGIDGDWTLQGPPYLLVGDFTKGRISLPWKFDLVWSVEVAEHVAKRYEQNFLRTCLDNCKGYFVLTASTNPWPRLHVNVRSREYWVGRMAQLGWRVRDDVLQPMLERSTMKREFLRTTGMVFSK